MKWRILTLRLGIYSPIPLLPPLKSLHNGYFSKNYNHQLFLRWSMCQAAKKAMFTSCHWGKLKLTLLAQTSFSTSPKNVLMFGLISQFFCNLNSSKKLHLLIGQVNNRIHQPDSKIHQPRLSDTTFFANDVRGLDHYSKQIMLTLTLTLFRDLDRERSKLEQQEKKVIADIKKMAKAGQMVCRQSLF